MCLPFEHLLTSEQRLRARSIRRRWCVRIVPELGYLAEHVSQGRWPQCTGFMLRYRPRYLFLRDATDNFQSYAVLKKHVREPVLWKLLKLIDFRGFSHARTQNVLAAILAGRFDTPIVHLPELWLEPPALHKDCLFCQ